MTLDELIRHLQQLADEGHGALPVYGLSVGGDPELLRAPRLGGIAAPAPGSRRRKPTWSWRAQHAPAGDYAEPTPAVELW